MNVYLLDDEQKAIDAMRFLLTEYFPEITVCGWSTDAEKAREEILAKRPDLLFLDISMPFENGLEFAKTMEQLKLLTVFVTAHPNHAIDAFKVSAFDYLLKPVQVKELLSVIQRAGKALSEPKKSTGLAGSTLKIRYEGKTLLIEPENVLYISSEGNYSTIHLINSKPIVLTKNLKQMELAFFMPPLFFRIHQSYIINLSKVTGYSHLEVILNNTITLAVSRQKRDGFLNIMETP